MQSTIQVKELINDKHLKSLSDVQKVLDRVAIKRNGFRGDKNTPLMVFWHPERLKFTSVNQHTPRADDWMERCPHTLVGVYDRSSSDDTVLDDMREYLLDRTLRQLHTQRFTEPEEKAWRLLLTRFLA